MYALRPTYTSCPFTMTPVRTLPRVVATMSVLPLPDATGSGFITIVIMSLPSSILASMVSPYSGSAARSSVRDAAWAAVTLGSRMRE